jgi:hypothetical protein
MLHALLNLLKFIIWYATCIAPQYYLDSDEESTYGGQGGIKKLIKYFSLLRAYWDSIRKAIDTKFNFKSNHYRSVSK